jgi:4-aminobutyrate aminotransferase-like enzyme
MASGDARSRGALVRGDLLPEIVTGLPGPQSCAFAEDLARCEAPGINTLGGDGAPALVWRAACGANVLDVDGNRFVDLTSGFGAATIGHRHPRVVAAAAQQATELLHGLGDVAAHPARIALAARLCALAPVDSPRVHFAVSGADAVEIAWKTALLATGRQRLLAFDPGYHGLTLGALAATSRAEFRAPFAPQLSPHVDRLPFACALDLVAERLGAGEAAGGVAAVLVEPIVGREGVLVPPAGWLAGLSRLCREAGAVLILDEILTGFGRTGRLFACEHEAVRPDLLCCGKGLGGGLPIAAVIGGAGLMNAWRTDGEALHTGTFVAHPLACAAALATLDVLADERLVARAEALGETIRATLSRVLPAGVALRGRGALWGLELPDAESARRLVDALRSRGLLLLRGGPAGRVVELLPPLVVTEAQLGFALAALADELGAVGERAS